jgi:3-oxoacyl-[acyl-carrier protein] reductase
VRLAGQVVYLIGAGPELSGALTRAGARVVPVAAAFDAGERPNAVVYAALDPVALEARPLVDVDDVRFAAIWERGMRAAIACCQSAFRAFAGAGGRIVFVVPTVSMSGAAGLAPLCALLEGQRILAKSAARQWGPAGITVNVLAPALAGFDGDTISLAPPALGPIDVGEVLVGLLAPEMRDVTGTTVGADGGIWMAP